MKDFTDVIRQLLMEDESNTHSMLQCQSCGNEVEDEDELCCDEPEIISVQIDEDGEELYGEF